MVSTVYICAAALWIVFLSIHVIKTRRTLNVRMGDGGHDELLVAQRMHGNAVEYLPILLILLVVLEMNGANAGLIHSCGIIMLSGRVLHAIALKKNDLKIRVTGMMLTFAAIFTLVISNLIYVFK